MMFFQDGQYPRCGRVLRERIPSIDFSSRIFLAFVESCDNIIRAREVFAVGTYPRVVIKKIPRKAGKGFAGGRYEGECVGGRLNYIYVDTDQADGLENDPDWETALTSSSNFEKIVLHEAVHWARFVGRKPAAIDLTGKKLVEPGKSPLVEAGSFFDHRAFGFGLQDHEGHKCKYGVQTLEQAIAAERKRMRSG